jgi:hypothetical protein
MPYVFTDNRVPSLGIHELQVFRMGSIFDPDFTGTALGQPFGHDQWATFYERYQVISMKAVTTFRWMSGQAPLTVMCFAYPDSDTTSPTYASTKMERYPGQYKMLKPDPTSSCTITNYYNAKKFWHKKTQDDNELRAKMTTNPVRNAYLVTGIQSPTNLTNTAYVQMSTKIFYRVKLLDPFPVGAS